MRKLLSLPPNLANQFHEIENKLPQEFFCTHDPVSAKLGSGGGTAYLLESAMHAEAHTTSLQEWLAKEPRILMHAGGQSRRLPAYAPSGKILTPVPVFRWARGQSLRQHLMDLQLPLLEDLLHKAAASQHTLIACGDALIRTSEELPDLPEVDVLCLGIWVKPEQASRHGVFFTKRNNPQEFSFSLQKPNREKLSELAAEYNYMVDVGIWLLSDRAVKVLFDICGWKEKDKKFENGLPAYLDLYGEFGLYLGTNPTKQHPLAKDLSSAAIALPGGEFYHFGRSEELIDSSLALQNLVINQRHIHHRHLKPHPSMFVMNAKVDISLEQKHDTLWIENSHIAEGWELSRKHLITGVPENDWKIKLKEGICLDIVPVDAHTLCVRPYGITDVFKGDLPVSHWMGAFTETWFKKRNITWAESGLDEKMDIQQAPIFPLVQKDEIEAGFIQWMLDENPQPSIEYKNRWLKERLSAEQISIRADLRLLYKQRESLRRASIIELAKNAKRSIFYQLDLADLAYEYQEANLPLPPEPKGVEVEPLLSIHDAMFRSEVGRKNKDENEKLHEQKAFSGLRDLLYTYAHEHKVSPKRNVLTDQIVWARSPVRLDLAGGWTDTPPYCLLYGGRVVNVAVELNGQAPIQVYAKPILKNEIVIRSIDLSYEERFDSFEELRNYDQIGEAFAIPKAALALAGFLPEFSQFSEATLPDQLKKAGGGIELTLLAAVPKGSGLGTSSILAAAVLGALSNFYNLSWDLMEIGHRTLILEQMLTSGGGWQDQYGGILPGIKYLETKPGLDQRPLIRWLPEISMEGAATQNCMLLYYTGITRVAHNILSEIVRGMFLNSKSHLKNVHALYRHAEHTHETIQKGNYEQLASMIAKTWKLNKALDSGTNPPAVEEILVPIQTHLLGAKLLGAGGGGFLLMMAKDPQAATHIRQILSNNPPNERARFVDFAISKTGLQVSRS